MQFYARPAYGQRTAATLLCQHTWPLKANHAALVQAAARAATAKPRRTKEEIEADKAQKAAAKEERLAARATAKADKEVGGGITCVTIPSSRMQLQVQVVG
jgi:hypothetical protein